MLLPSPHVARLGRGHMRFTCFHFLLSRRKVESIFHMASMALSCSRLQCAVRFHYISSSEYILRGVGSESCSFHSTGQYYSNRNMLLLRPACHFLAISHIIQKCADVCGESSADLWKVQCMHSCNWATKKLTHLFSHQDPQISRYLLVKSLYLKTDQMRKGRHHGRKWKIGMGLIFALHLHLMVLHK